MCDMYDVAHECEGDMVRRGDLLVCAKMGKTLSPTVGRVEGEKRCVCGGFRPIGTPCGEPCSY